MKLTPMGKTQPVITNAPNVQAANAAKARAAAAFMGQKPSAQPAAQQHPVQNPSAVAPEEMGAIMAVPQPNIDTSTQLEDTATQGAQEETAAQPAAQEPPPRTEDPQLSAKFAALARREAQARRDRIQREQQYKAREEALKAREEALKQAPAAPDLSQYIPKSKLKESPLEALEEAEVSYDQLVQHALNQPQQDPRSLAQIRRLEERIQKLTASIEEQSKKAEETQQQGYQAAIRQIKADAQALVKTDPQFEMIRTTGSTRDVVELIEKTYQEDGVVLSVEDACQQVEDYLTEEAIKLANAKKIQAKLQASRAASTTPAAKQTATVQKQPMKTLTNNVGSSRQLSAKERAILAFNGQLQRS